jgi:hypothetical protein
MPHYFHPEILFPENKIVTDTANLDIKILTLTHTYKEREDSYGYKKFPDPGTDVFCRLKNSLSQKVIHRLNLFLSYFNLLHILFL